MFNSFEYPTIVVNDFNLLNGQFDDPPLGANMTYQAPMAVASDQSTIGGSRIKPEVNFRTPREIWQGFERNEDFYEIHLQFGLFGPFSEQQGADPNIKQGTLKGTFEVDPKEFDIIKFMPGTFDTFTTSNFGDNAVATMMVLVRKLVIGIQFRLPVFKFTFELNRDIPINEPYNIILMGSWFLMRHGVRSFRSIEDQATVEEEIEE
ncbi:hypothetical protein 2 [Hubei diptera virus 14]|uniref:hypothetical protein 2 n=1 Tax=Hubei diptera virus 14 TaxID=1922875 RepID=UPI00090A8901|nr:hypothetical protein 2 [Hubei diptera virus 14]APG75806.1 hypothetical protein 2 [Hubei diptera virus 14]